MAKPPSASHTDAEILAAPTDLSWLVMATQRLSVFEQSIMGFDSRILSLQRNARYNAAARMSEPVKSLSPSDALRFRPADLGDVGALVRLINSAFRVEQPFIAGDRTSPDGVRAYMERGKFLLAERSEEHTSELQSPCNLVCRLLLEKKKHHMIRYR